MKTYNHLNGEPLQPWYSITIDRSGTSVTVAFNSRIHVNKAVKCSFSYDHTFTDCCILRDSALITWVYTRYGVRIHC